MAEFTRTKAFAALADVLALPGTDSLRFVDVAIATPVIDLREIMRAGLTDRWSFARAFTSAGAASFNAGVDPFSTPPGNWGVVYRGAKPLTVAEALPADHEALVVGCGVMANADTLKVWIGRELTDTTVSRTVSNLFYADSAPDVGLAAQRPLTSSAGGTEFRTPLPWPLVPASRDPARLKIRGITTGAINFSLFLSVVSGPRGLLPIAE